MAVTAPSVFLLNITGEIETARFIEDDSLYFYFCYTHGQDWEHVSGLSEGFSQFTQRSEDERQVYVWNFPLDITYKSTNPFGWPQLILTVFGKDVFGNDVVRGYTCCHLPLTPGYHTRRLSTFVPESASTIQKLMAWLTGRRPEFVDPKIITRGQGREVTRVRSQGEIVVNFNVMLKDMSTLGYDCGGQSRSPYLSTISAQASNCHIKDAKKKSM
ncbi:unnamed protein product, partial [Meganyctiphanes norvegica]